MFEAIISVFCLFGNFICILAKFFLKPTVFPFVVIGLVGIWAKHQMN